MHWRTLARFVRLPLVFTAIGDAWAGYWIALPAGSAADPRTLATLAGASSCLYLAGMALNGLVDREQDAALHPDRPLPSGDLSAKSACVVALALPAAAALFLRLLPIAAFHAGIWILLSSVAYNLRLKRSAAPGSLAMGLCRGLNLLMGAAAAGPVPLQPPVILGAYVATLTLVSTLEERDRRFERWVRIGLLGILPLDALLVGLYAGRWLEAGIVLSLLAGRIILGRYIPVN